MSPLFSAKPICDDLRDLRVSNTPMERMLDYREVCKATGWRSKDWLEGILMGAGACREVPFCLLFSVVQVA